MYMCQHPTNVKLPRIDPNQHRSQFENTTGTKSITIAELICSIDYKIDFISTGFISTTRAGQKMNLLICAKSV